MKKRFQKATCLLLVAAMLISGSPAQAAAKSKTLHAKNVVSSSLSDYDTDYSSGDDYDYQLPDSSDDDTNYDQSDDTTYDDWNSSTDDSYNDNDYNDDFDDSNNYTDVVISSLKQTALTTTSLTVSWNKTSADYYIVTCTKCNDVVDDSTKITRRTTNTSYKFTGLDVGSKYYITVAAHGPNEESGYLSSDAITAYTKIKSITGLHMDNSFNSQTYFFKWKNLNAATNYQFKVTEKKSGRLVKKTKNTSLNSAHINYPSQYKIYIAHVRGVQKVGSKTYYTGWRKLALIPQPPVKSFYVKKIRNRNTVTKRLVLSWKQVIGATGYDIYISRKLNSGYKKVASVNAKSNSLTLKKVFGKKINGKYYVSVVAKTKLNGKTCKSANNLVYNTVNNDFDTK